MYYIRAFVESLHNRSWIVSQRKQISKAIGYTAILAAIFSLAVLFTFGRMVQKDIEPIAQELLQQIPEFEAEVKNGILTIDKLEQPYRYDYINEEDGSGLFYVDTNPSTTIDMAALTDGYEFSVIIDEEQIQVLEGGTIDGFLFREADDFQVNNQDVTSFVESLSFGKIFFVIALILFFFMTFFLTVGVLLWTLVGSLFVLVVAKIMKLPVSFINIVTMGLFARTVLFILDLFRLFPIYPQAMIRFLPTLDILLWVGVMVFVLKEYKKTIKTDIIKEDSHSI